MKVLITRPQDDAIELAHLLDEMGVSSHIFPLLEIEQKVFTIDDPAQYQAVIVTSANSLKSLKNSPFKTSLLTTPLFAVGAASASLASENGFSIVLSADGDLPALKDLILGELSPENGPLLYLSGDIISGDMQALLEKEGFKVDRVELYRAERMEAFDEKVRQGFETGELGGVVLFSKRSASIFAELFLKSGVKLSQKCQVFCLSEAISQRFSRVFSGKASEAGFDVKISEQPNQGEILNLIRKSVA